MKLIETTNSTDRLLNRIMTGQFVLFVLITSAQLNWSYLLCLSLQLLFGFVSFLFPKLPDGLRAAYLKVHVFFGMFIFMMVIGTALIGINEKLFFQLSTK